MGAVCFLSVVKETLCFGFSGTEDFFHEMGNDMDRCIGSGRCVRWSRWPSRIFRAIIEEEIASDAGSTVEFGQV